MERSARLSCEPLEGSLLRSHPHPTLSRKRERVPEQRAHQNPRPLAGEGRVRVWPIEPSRDRAREMRACGTPGCHRARALDSLDDDLRGIPGPKHAEHVLAREAIAAHDRFAAEDLRVD